MLEKERKREEIKREERIFPERPGGVKKIKNLVKAVHRYESTEHTSTKRHEHPTDRMITSDRSADKTPTLMKHGSPYHRLKIK
jgi:hypothetical protein